MKGLKKLLIATMCLSTILAGVGCGGAPVVDEDSDPNDKRPSVMIKGFNGGYGIDWLKTMAREFNAENPESPYKVTVMDAKDTFETISAEVATNVQSYDMFMSNGDIHTLIDRNLLEDISSVWQSTPIGSTETMEQMLENEDLYSKAYGRGTKRYAIPWQESIRTLVYDHEVFMRYGFLLKKGSTKENYQFVTSKTDELSVGKDGVEGTYDDGHPETEEQWAAMYQKILTSGLYGVMYTGENSWYTNDLYYMIMAQYDGDAYNLHYTMDDGYDFDGDGTIEEDEKGGYDFDGDGTIENDEKLPEYGYKLMSMGGAQKAVNFMDEYFGIKEGETSKKVTIDSTYLGYSHKDAQTDFVYNMVKGSGTRAAFLVEGDWWENEARLTFEAITKAKYEGYDFRTHDYRFMTLPIFEGQKGTGNTYVLGDSMYIAVVARSSSDKKAVCKEFLKFVMQPKYIRYFTVASGGVMPYDVEFETEDYAQMSPFTKSFLSLYHDPRNTIIRTTVLDVASDWRKSGGHSTTSTGKSDWVILNSLYKYTASTVYTDIINNVTNNWASYVAGYNTYKNS